MIVERLPSKGLSSCSKCGTAVHENGWDGIIFEQYDWGCRVSYRIHCEKCGKATDESGHREECVTYWDYLNSNEGKWLDNY